MKTLTIENNKATFTPNYAQAENLLESALNTLTKGNAAQDEDALWLMYKTVIKLGIKRAIASFFHCLPDGYLITFGCAIGFEDEDAKIDAFNIGYVKGLTSAQGK